ncbi:hypothetical protein LRR18_06465 [Mangrovimonas sp. AS39]|uniref:hypothetical protein n=1 Tax=Mangrovimonas futianensis TaxID=2895523 RepID=UPI001E32300D|nr:hypothetical protein [Mangrovimonas futianensis]MCF1191225.1 hypothetical protein [Mangrovimonas futianensis]MCF1194920.1 hypothetical protein [Mangrovimonas futianensis]
MKTLMGSTSTNVIFFNNQPAFIKRPHVASGGVETRFKFKKEFLVIIGFEDLIVSDYLNTCDANFANSFLGIQELRLLIIRDVRNLMASRLNYETVSKGLGESEVQRHISQVPLNDFYLSKFILSLKVANRCGGGSSFETDHYGSRYLNFQDNSIYQKLVEG